MSWLMGYNYSLAATSVLVFIWLSSRYGRVPDFEFNIARA
jgi:hypothetical protein